jgi:vacuolar-type H+-ATPase subunit I/STV1
LGEEERLKALEIIRKAKELEEQKFIEFDKLFFQKEQSRLQQALSDIEKLKERQNREFNEKLDKIQKDQDVLLYFILVE